MSFTNKCKRNDFIKVFVPVSKLKQRKARAFQGEKENIFQRTTTVLNFSFL